MRTSVGHVPGTTRRESPFYAATIGLGRVAMRALALDLRVRGLAHLPRTGPVLLASNHVSFPDFLFVGRAALERGRHVRFLSRHDVWGSPLVARAMDAMGHVPVDRQAPAAAYLHARRLLRAGEAVCAFPEAGISWTWTVRSLMPGVAALARETGVPVVPVAVWGPQRLWSVDAAGAFAPPRWVRGLPVEVSLGEPVAVAPGADVTAATTDLGHRLTALLEELQRDPVHAPRPGEHAPWHPAHLGGQAPARPEVASLESLPRSAVPPTWGPLPVRGAGTAGPVEAPAEDVTG
ncbi:1-acyl-sn-glycerol-3-phosphate acyltransferase [Nocardioides perillae]|uniref:1-acyl-sn-glycerol-3-phosphate acyltransferase n=1 Tax=Nocardioides perillae TaxID=1119534 RepID=A0A7Y9UP23_9ACTN|nr:1-acyl-sn-glycerol-3-phosphate acyltransferase [Nocardioides perillae]